MMVNFHIFELFDNRLTKPPKVAGLVQSRDNRPEAATHREVEVAVISVDCQLPIALA